MDALWHNQPEFGFGVDPLNPHPARAIDAVGHATKKGLRDRVIQSCPRVPGVYGMLDPKGRLIYVGKSKSLRSRILSYFAESNADEKGGRIIKNSRAIQWETQPSEFAALLREQQLIRQFAPRWNVQGVPKRQRPVYLCLGRQPASYFFLAKTPPADVRSVEGPFFGASRMQNAVDALNKIFQLRDCSQNQVFQFSEQMSLFDIELRPGCLRLEIGTCLGPCAAACTREQYDVNVSAAQSFLDGFNDQPIATVKEQMETAVANRQYELAGRAHQSLKSLEYLNRKLEMLAKARRDYTFIYSVDGYDGCHTWYLIHCGEVSDVAVAPRDNQQFEAFAPTLQSWKAVTASVVDRGHGPFPHTLGIVASWFRKHRSEKKRTIRPNAKALAEGLAERKTVAV